jgi:hypothetical protein
MKPAMAAFIRDSDAPAAREIGRLLLILAALLRASGLVDESLRALGSGIIFLERAAALTRAASISDGLPRAGR